MGENFSKEYVSPYYIGESLFALIPSAVAILQGVGKDQGCQNITTSKVEWFNETLSFYANQTTLDSIPLKPKFSIKIYFMIIFVLMCISFITYLYLDCFKTGKRSAQSKGARKNSEPNGKYGSHIKGIDELATSLLNVTSKEKPIARLDEEHEVDATKEKVLLYILTFFLTFFFYGIAAGVQTYSALPYGNDVYHLAVNLSNIFLPISIFLSIWSYSVSLKRIVFEFFFAMIFITYITVAACLSPCPPLVNHKFGSILIVVSWVISQSMFMRCRCIIATRMERFGERTLTIVGFFTVVGEVVGGIIIYIIVDIFELLKEQPTCNPISCSAN